MDRPIGLVADTHNLLRPELLDGFREACVSRILHLGDVCTEEVFGELGRIAPVEAVRGNCDGLLDRLPWTHTVEIWGKTAYLIHIRADLDLDPAEAGIDFVFYGHSHIPADETVGGVRYFNPGSAGPRRFSHPITYALIHPGAELELVEIPAP